MKYVIDTDILIYFLKNNNKVVEKFSKVSDRDIHTTIINYTELLFGAYNSLKVHQNLKSFKEFLKSISILNYTRKTAETFARLKAELKRNGNMIADMDLMIASICIENGCTLVTNNTGHFSRIKDLSIDNWSR